MKSLASFSAAVAVIPSPSTNLLNLTALLISIHFWLSWSMSLKISVNFVFYYGVNMVKASFSQTILFINVFASMLPSPGFIPFLFFFSELAPLAISNNIMSLSRRSQA